MTNWHEGQFARCSRPQEGVQGGVAMTNRQDSRFAPPKAAREGGVQEGVVMTNRQDSRFAPPKATRKGGVQGCTP